MQVEVKALLDGPVSYKRLLTALEGHFLSQTVQENHFLDTPTRELYQQGTILRVRLFLKPDAHTEAVTQQHAGLSAAYYCGAKLMLKEHSHVEDGSQVSWTAEETITPELALSLLSRPRTIYQLLGSLVVNHGSDCEDLILKRLGREYAREHLEALEYVGCFTTLRTAFRFPNSQTQSGLKVHVDKTTYPFGERYEVEIPDIVVPVHDVLEEASLLLTNAGCVFEYAEESKFQRFAHGMAASKSSSHMVQDVKVVLATMDDVNKVCASLEQNFISEKFQENIFFDGFDDELGQKGAFLRLRKVGDKQFFIVLKEHQDVDQGSQVNWTQECELSPDVAHGLLHDPSSFLATRDNVTIAHTLYEKFQIRRLRSIGRFVTQRRSFQWVNSQTQPQGGLQIRLDVTQFPFGEHYEVEVSNIEVPVSDVLAELETVLAGMSVNFKRAVESKLDCFLRGCGRK